MIKKKIVLTLVLALSMQGISGITQVQDVEIELIPLSTQSVSTNNTPLIRIQKSKIDENKATLKSELFYKNITRIGTKSLAAIAMAYVLYSYIDPWFHKVDKPAVIPGVIPADTGAQLERIWKIVDPDFFSWQWIKNNGKNIGNGLMGSSIAYAGSVVASNVQKAVFHPDSLEWFVQNKTNLFDLLPFQMDPRGLINGSPVELQMHMTMLRNQDRIKKSTIEDLREYINTLDGFESMPDTNKEMTIYLIKSTSNSMVTALELVLGFMAHKQESATAAIAQEIDSNIRYAINSTNIFCDKLAQAIECPILDSQKKKQECLSALSSLKGELHRICMRFVVIEREQGI